MDPNTIIEAINGVTDAIVSSGAALCICLGCILAAIYVHKGS